MLSFIHFCVCFEINKYMKTVLCYLPCVHYPFIKYLILIGIPHILATLNKGISERNKNFDIAMRFITSINVPINAIKGHNTVKITYLRYKYWFSMYLLLTHSMLIVEFLPLLYNLPRGVFRIIKIF